MEVNRVWIEVPGALHLAQLRQELEAEAFDVEYVPPMEPRGMPPWLDSQAEVLAVVQLGTYSGAAIAGATRAIRKWQARRREETPPRRSKLLGPNGEPIVIDDEDEGGPLPC